MKPAPSSTIKSAHALQAQARSELSRRRAGHRTHCCRAGRFFQPPRSLKSVPAAAPSRVSRPSRRPRNCRRTRSRSGSRACAHSSRRTTSPSSSTTCSTFDFAAAAAQTGRKLAVVGNLPYYITSPILLKLAASHAALDRAVLMVQREVADRVTAAPGSRDYGLLSVTVQMLRSRREALYPAAPRVLAAARCALHRRSLAFCAALRRARCR